MGAAARRRLRARARRDDRRPGRADGEGRAAGDLPVGLAGGGRRQPRPSRCIPTRASTPPTRCPRSCAASTTRCGAPTRSSGPRTAARATRDWMVPIVADAEAGFGGPLNAYELMKSMIEAGAAGVHWEDQLAVREEVRPHGRQGARPDAAARPHADRGPPRRRRAATCPRSSSPAPTRSAPRCITSDVDERDREFLTGERTAEGFFHDAAVPRVADQAGPRLRARTPTSSGARRRRPTSTRPAASPRRSRPSIPDKMLAYNCSPSFNWKQVPRRLDHRPLPEGARRDGLRVPVHHPRRLARAQRCRCSSWPAPTTPTT